MPHSSVSLVIGFGVRVRVSLVWLVSATSLHNNMVGVCCHLVNECLYGQKIAKFSTWFQSIWTEIRCWISLFSVSIHIDGKYHQRKMRSCDVATHQLSVVSWNALFAHTMCLHRHFCGGNTTVRIILSPVNICNTSVPMCLDTSAPVRMSYGQFGTGPDVSCARTVSGPKCM